MNQFDDMLDFCRNNSQKGQKHGTYPNPFSNNKQPRNRWKKEEDLQLALAVEQYGNRWAQIALEIENKEPRQCQARWKILQNKNPLGEDYQEESVGEVKPPKKKQKHKKEQMELIRSNRPIQFDQYPPHYQQLYQQQTTQSQQQQQLTSQQSPSKQQQQSQQQLQQQQQQQQQQEQFLMFSKEQRLKQQQITQFCKNWNKQDEELLLQAHRIYMGDWKKICQRFPERQPKSCQQKIEELAKHHKVNLPFETTLLIDDGASEQFDISQTDDGVEEYSEQVSSKEGVLMIKTLYSVQECYTQIQKLLKTQNHTDAIVGIKDSITKLLIS